MIILLLSIASVFAIITGAIGYNEMKMRKAKERKLIVGKLIELISETEDKTEKARLVAMLSDENVTLADVVAESSRV